MALDHLAPELLTRIFEFVVEDVGEVTKEVIRSLSLVNKQFFEVMEPIRFRSFTVSSSVQLKLLTLRLTDDPARRGYVRELHLSDYKKSPIAPPDEPDAFVFLDLLRLVSPTLRILSCTLFHTYPSMATPLDTPRPALLSSIILTPLPFLQSLTLRVHHLVQVPENAETQIQMPSLRTMHLSAKYRTPPSKKGEYAAYFASDSDDSDEDDFDKDSDIEEDSEVHTIASIVRALPSLNTLMISGLFDVHMFRYSAGLKRKDNIGTSQKKNELTTPKVSIPSSPSLQLPSNLRRIVCQQYFSDSSSPFYSISLDLDMEPIPVEEGLVWLADIRCPSLEDWQKLICWDGREAFRGSDVVEAFPISSFPLLVHSLSAMRRPTNTGFMIYD